MFRGTVIDGNKIGRTLGYPTANLDISVKDTKCNPGVYAGNATLKRKKYNCAIVLHSLFDKVEVYLFDYTGPEFYGEILMVDPIQKVSEIESQDNENDLMMKIESDIALVRKVLKI